MGRAPCCDKDGLKKGPWTPEEDQKLTDHIQKNGPGNWRNLPTIAGLQRCGKSCRLRWTNYLRPDIKRGRFSFEEEETIIQLHSVLGNKWSAIAARLPGRTDNEIKNYWNTHIRKRLLRMGIDPVTHSPRIDLLDLSSILGSSLCNPSLLINNLSNLLTTQQALFNPQLLRLASTMLSLNGYNKLENNNGTMINSNLFSHNTLLGNQLLPQLSIEQDNGFSTEMISTQTMQDPIPNSNLDHDQLGLPSNNMMNPIPSFVETLVADLPGSSYFQNLLDYTNNEFGFESALATPISSTGTTPLHSSPTNDDERESFCSNLLKFEIPGSWTSVNSCRNFSM